MKKPSKVVEIVFGMSARAWAKDLNSSCGVAEAAGGLASGMTKGLLVSKLTAKGALLTNVISPAP